MAERLVTVFGGSGFVGRYVVHKLIDAGWRVRVAVRDPEDAMHLKPMGEVGRVAAVQANIRDDASVAAAVFSADAVINLVGVLYESGKQKFQAIHEEGAARIARAAADAGVARLVQISAIGADPDSPSVYARTKAAGEAGARSAFPGATILRPSLVFGPEDGFFNLFGLLSRLSPVLPLIDGGKTRFQPVYVGDVASAVVAVLDDAGTAGQTYELGGPGVYSFEELMREVLAQTGRQCLLVPLPAAIAKFEAAFLQLLPKPLMTVDQVKLLQRDNVVAEDANSLADLGIQPTPMAAILPGYMFRYRRPGGLTAKEAS